MKNFKLSKKILNRNGIYNEKYINKKLKLLLDDKYDEKNKNKIIVCYLHINFLAIGIYIDNFYSEYEYIINIDIYDSYYINYINYKYNNIKIHYNGINYNNCLINDDYNDYDDIEYNDDNSYKYRHYGYCIIGKPITFVCKNIIYLNIAKIDRSGLCNIIYYYYYKNNIKAVKCTNYAVSNVSAGIYDTNIIRKKNLYYLESIDFKVNEPLLFEFQPCKECFHNFIKSLNQKKGFMTHEYKIPYLLYIIKILNTFLYDKSTVDYISKNIYKYLEK